MGHRDRLATGSCAHDDPFFCAHWSAYCRNSEWIVESVPPASSSRQTGKKTRFDQLMRRMPVGWRGRAASHCVSKLWNIGSCGFGGPMSPWFSSGAIS